MTDKELNEAICTAVTEALTPIVAKMKSMSDRIEELEKAVVALSAFKAADMKAE